jgi:hypothetical protein
MSVKALIVAACVFVLGVASSSIAADGWLAAHIRTRHWIAIAIVIMLVVVVLDHAHGEARVRVSRSEAAAALDTLRTRGRQSAERELGLSSDLRMIDRYIPARPRARGIGEMRLQASLDELFASNFLLLGDPGSGKSVFLARLVLHHCQFLPQCPVIYLKMGGRLNRSQPTLPDWIRSELDASGIRAHVVDDWIARPDTVLVLDGLDELPIRTALDTVVEIEMLRRQHPMLRVVVSCRTDEYDDIVRGHETGLTLQILEMPLLSTVTVRQSLSAHQEFVRLSKASQSELIAACRSPLLLDFALEGLRVGELLDARGASLDDRTLTAQWVGRRIAEAQDHVDRNLQQNDGRSDVPLRSTASWIAATLGNNKTTLDLATLTPSVLSPRRQRAARRKHNVMTSTTYAGILIILGLIVGLGVGSLILTVAWWLLVNLVSITPLGERFANQRLPPIIVRDRGWSRKLVPIRLAVLSRTSFVKQAGAAVAGGLAVGVALGTLGGWTWLNHVDGRYLKWFTVAAIPLAGATLTGLGAGLVGGLIGAIAFGLRDDLADCVIAGLCSGLAALFVFSLRDLGENVVGFTYDDIDSSSMADRFRRSSSKTAVLELGSWISMGATYGISAWLLTGNWQFMIHGLAAGVVGASFFILLASIAPPIMLRLIENGLRTEGHLGTLTIDEVISELVRVRVLTQTVNGSSVRFRHPLVQRTLSQ